MKNNIFYIYEWFKVESNEVFYVGKGCNDRYLVTHNRNDYFKRIFNKYECDVRITHSDLSEDEAYELEEIIITNYKKQGLCTANLSTGGRGGMKGYVRGEEYSKKVSGSGNNMYGRPWWNENTPEWKIEQWRQNISKATTGENNSQYGKPFHERMDEETYKGWLEAHKKITGKNNPNYGNRKLSKKYRENPELSKEKQSRPASQNGRAKKCEMYDLEGNLIECFDYIGACAEYIVKNNLSRTKNINAVRDRITISIKKNKSYINHYFKTY